MSAGYKLAFLYLLSLAAFFPGPEWLSFAVLVSTAFIIVVFSFAAGTNPQALLRRSGPLFFVILAVFVFQAVEFSPPGIRVEGFKESALFCVRIGTAFAAGALLFFVTTPGEIRKSLSRLETFFRIKKLKLSMYLPLMLGFIPMLFRLWEELNLAWKSRGGRNNLSRLVILTPLLVERMMLKAAEAAEAMEARAALL
jgi:energy-coupling factor transporter transmembrane protein EcfT